MKIKGKSLFLGLGAGMMATAAAVFLYPSVLLQSEEKDKHVIKNEVIHNIMTRMSVRHFKGLPVSKDTLELLVKAGMAAPTAVNMQPWTFIIVTDRQILNKLGDELPYAKMLYQAGAAIVVCGVPEWAHMGKEKDYWVVDCSAATENILLAAHSLGLGAVWTAVYPNEDRIEPVRSILNIPENIIPLNVIPIGYPTGEDKPKDKYKPERIHWEKY